MGREQSPYCHEATLKTAVGRYQRRDVDSRMQNHCCFCDLEEIDEYAISVGDVCLSNPKTEESDALVMAIEKKITSKSNPRLSYSINRFGVIAFPKQVEVLKPRAKLR